MSEKIHKCINCGAEIAETDVKCPFCGYINEEGAEKEYMDRLYELKDDLDEVDDEAASEYGRGYGRILKIIVITLAVLLIITGIIYGIYSASNNRRTDPDKSSEMLEEMAWRKEAFKEFDSLYDRGDYDELCEAVFASTKGNHSITEWKHYWFVTVYNDYLLTKQDLERVDEKGWNEYDAGVIFYRCCFCYYDELYKGGKYSKLTDEEIENLKPVYEYMNGVLHDRLCFTDEDMVKLHDRLIGEYSDLDFDRCYAVGKEYMDQFK